MVVAVVVVGMTASVAATHMGQGQDTGHDTTPHTSRPMLHLQMIALKGVKDVRDVVK